MLKNKLNDRRGVFEAVWMMLASLLDDHFDWALQLLVAAREFRRIFLERHTLIRIATHVDDNA